MKSKPQKLSLGACAAVGMSAIVLLLGTALGYVLASNLTGDRADRVLQFKFAELKRHNEVIQNQLEEAVAAREAYQCIARKEGRIKIGQLAPKLSAGGWINDHRRTAANLDGKVVVLDIWADW